MQSVSPRAPRLVVLPQNVPGTNTVFRSAADPALGAEWRRAHDLSPAVRARTGAEARLAGGDEDDVVLGEPGATGVRVVYAVRSLAETDPVALVLALEDRAAHGAEELTVVAGRPAAEAGSVLRLLGLGGRRPGPPREPTGPGAALVRSMRESLGTVKPATAETVDRGLADAGSYLDWVAARAGTDVPDLRTDLRRLGVVVLGDDDALAPAPAAVADGLPLEHAAGAAIAVVQGVFDAEAVGTGQPTVGTAGGRDLAQRLFSRGDR